MRKYLVIEDNGGGLTLVVFEADSEEKIAYIHSGYEYTPGQLREDLQALRDGAEPENEWDNDLLNEPPCPEYESPENPTSLEYWFPWEQKDVGWDIVADDEGIYPHKMGGAARQEFNISD